MNTPVMTELEEETDPLEVNGRAFCSGADAITLYQLVIQGNVEECRKFSETLYKFVYIQGMYLKPHVAILDGITMGRGAGISLPGMFHVVTDKTVFCNPARGSNGFPS